MRRLATAFVILLAALGVAACGESSEEKAQTAVCDARDDIAEEVGELEAITPATFTTDDVTESLQSIQSDLSEIRDAQADLSDDRRQQVESANKAFAGQVEDAVTQVARSITAQDAADQVTQALQQLATGYEEAFSRVDCS
jgi:hypothetical protein